MSARPFGLVVQIDADLRRRMNALRRRGLTHRFQVNSALRGWFARRDADGVDPGGGTGAGLAHLGDDPATGGVLRRAGRPGRVVQLGGVPNLREWEPALSVIRAVDGLRRAA